MPTYKVSSSELMSDECVHVQIKDMHYRNRLLGADDVNALNYKLYKRSLAETSQQKVHSASGTVSLHASDAIVDPAGTAKYAIAYGRGSWAIGGKATSPKVAVTFGPSSKAITASSCSPTACFADSSVAFTTSSFSPGVAFDMQSLASTHGAFSPAITLDSRSEAQVHGVQAIALAAGMTSIASALGNDSVAINLMPEGIIFLKEGSWGILASHSGPQEGSQSFNDIIVLKCGAGDGEVPEGHYSVRNNKVVSIVLHRAV